MRASEQRAEAIAERVRRLRKASGLSQAQFAARLGVSKLSVMRWEHGRTAPTAPVLGRLGRFEAECMQAPTAERRTSGGDSMSPHGGFVGRERELSLLRGALANARRSEGSLVLLSGEPGIGKTRTMQEVVPEARASGIEVLWGRCYEGGWAPPYIPWIEVLGPLLERQNPDRLRRLVGAGIGALAALVPSLRGQLADLPPPASLSPAEERFRLHDAITRVLLAAAESSPLLLCLDDLHWADQGSLLLLQALLRALAGARLLVVGAFRERELTPEDPLARSLAALTRQPEAQRLLLAPLTFEESGSLGDALPECAYGARGRGAALDRCRSDQSRDR